MTKKFKVLAEKLKSYSHKEVIELIKSLPKSKGNDILRAKAFYDLKFFARYFFCETIDGKVTGHTKDPFNRMHLDFFKKYHPEEESIQKVILASRGSAKTTLICVIYVLHKVCYSTEKNICILSSTQELSRGKSEDIHNEVTNNEKLKEVYGLKFAGSKKASKTTFVVESMYGDCRVHSQSFYSQIRGTKHRHHRLTLIILDDIVHGEEVFSEEQRIKTERQFNTDIWHAKQPYTNIIYIGTRIHSEDLGSKLVKHPTWDDSEYPSFEKWPTNMDMWAQWEDIRKNPTRSKEENARIADKFYEDNKEKMTEGAKVLWPEREDTHYLMKERFTIGEKEFGAEKQMIAFLTGDCVFNKFVWFYPTERHGVNGYYFPDYDKFIQYDEARFVKYYALDPATGERKKQTQKKTLSQSARIIASKDTETGNLYIIDAFMDRKPPSKIIYEMYDLHHHHNFYRMGFEENLFRDMYQEHIIKVGKDWENEHYTHLTLPTVSIWNDIDKDQRIYGLEPYVSMGKIIINKHMNPEFLAQLQSYPNCDHNDGLDALQILWQIACKKQGFQSVSM